VQGSGFAQDAQLAFKTRLTQLQLSALKPNWPAMHLSGPLNFSADCSSSKTLPALAVQKITAYWCAPGTNDLNIKTSAQLEGKTLALSEWVQFKWRAQGTASHFVIDEWRAAAGQGSASLKGVLKHQQSTWQLQAFTQLTDFDVDVWLPGLINHTSTHHKSRLNLQSQIDLSGPDDWFDSTTPWLEKIAAKLMGTIALQVNQSWLNGMPLGGTFNFKRQHASEPLEISGKLDFGDNHVQLNASNQITKQAKLAKIHLELQAKMPSLMQMNALFGVLPPSIRAALGEVSGSVDVQAQLDGHWPNVSSKGQAEINQLKTNLLNLNQGHLNWQLGTQADAPIDIDAVLTQLVFKGQNLEKTTFSLKGTHWAHDLKLAIDSKVNLPLWMQRLQNLSTNSLHANQKTPQTIQLNLNSKGRFDWGDHRKPWAWKGVVEKLECKNLGVDALSWVNMNAVALAFEGGASPNLEVSQGAVDF
jgi:translocation and assembly module TamB